MFSNISRAISRRIVTGRRTIATTSRRYADPWPLPHTRQHMEATQTPEDAPRIDPLPRVNESEASLRARLVYQSRKRGTLETDLLLSTFAQENILAMTVPELQEYDKLLDEPDWDIYYWSTGKRIPPERWSNSPLLEKLRVHVRNEGNVVRRMPNLD